MRPPLNMLTTTVIAAVVLADDVIACTPAFIFGGVVFVGQGSFALGDAGVEDTVAVRAGHTCAVLAAFGGDAEGGGEEEEGGEEGCGFHGFGLVGEWLFGGRQWYGKAGLEMS